MASHIDRLLAKSLTDLKAYLSADGKPIPRGFIRALEGDPRRGAKQMAAVLRKRSLKTKAEMRRLDHLLRFERELWNQGIGLVAGVDEAGMAPLAGPVVAAAVILHREFKLPGLDDSKKITSPRRREDLADQIKRHAVCYASATAEVDEIDKLNIYHAGILAMRRAVEGLKIKPEYILVDARTIPDCQTPQRGIVRGDAASVSIAAASIIAKTTRDAHMIDLGRQYPGYGFESHKGYPTAMHVRALSEYGVLPVHRRSFAPIRAALGHEPEQPKLFPDMR
jgi:ribonuclease HII